MKINKINQIINAVKKNKTLKFVFFLNATILFFLFSISIISNFISQNFLAHILYSITILLIIFLLPGLNYTLILQITLKKSFSFFETLSLTALSFFILTPILFFIISLTTKFSTTTPIILYLISTITLLSFIYLERKENFEYISWTKEIYEITLKKILKSTYTWIFLLYTTIIIILITAYYPLPDLDPYYWLNLYQASFNGNDFVIQDTSYRPLFLSLIYLISKSAIIQPYFVFKYILPLLFLLILPPLFLLAKNIQNKSKSTIFLFSPLITASSLLYFLTPFSQIILTIICFYFIFLMLVSNLNKEKKYLNYIAGISIGLTSLYYEFSIIFFLIWFAITLLNDRKSIINITRNNKLYSLLLIILIFFNFNLYIINSIKFIYAWFGKFMHNALILKTNFSFPAIYNNIDGVPMGWGNFSGIIKYYAYYVGPVIFFFIFLIIFKLTTKKDFRKHFLNKIKETEIATLILIFIFSFSISEILPRFLNFTLLPERMWSFGSIFFIVILFIYITYTKKENKIFKFIVIFLTIISLSGAIYINNLKKYIITKEQLTSAKWIKKNLPENRIIISNNNKHLLQFFSQSDIILVPFEFYIQNSNFIELIESIIQEKQQNKYKNSRQEILNILNQNNNYEELKKILTELQDKIKIEEIQKKTTKIIETENKEYYIYYSETHPKNPYSLRPYTNLKTKIDNNKFIFDNNKNIFEKIYSDKKNQIFIWKILQKF